MIFVAYVEKRGKYGILRFPTQTAYEQKKPFIDSWCAYHNAGKSFGDAYNGLLLKMGCKDGAEFGRKIALIADFYENANSLDKDETIKEMLNCHGVDMNKQYLEEAEQLKHSHEDYKDTTNYHGAKGVYEPINVMDYMAKEYVKRGIPADKAMELCLALKYLLRLGTKDEAEKELFKAENFIHRVRTDDWMLDDRGIRNAAKQLKQLDEDIANA